MKLDPESQRKMLEEEIDKLTREIEDKGYWITGSQGQDRLNPALLARRQALEALRKLDVANPPPPASDELDKFLTGMLSHD